MTRDCKVSIIIPAYNASEYIEETLDSALQQVYKNIEIIIVDDDSTDDTWSIINNYCNNFPNLIKVYKNKGKGACAARNYGFELSSGNYIQYLDADDILNPQKIEKQMELLQSFGDNIIVSCYWGRFYKNWNSVNWKEQLINKDYCDPINWLIDSWDNKGMGQTSIWLTPRSLIESAGLWNENLLINQDGEFFSRVLLRSKGIKFCKEAKVYYRSGNLNSITSKNKFGKAKAISLLMSYNLYESNCKNYIDSSRVKKSLANNYLIYIFHYYPFFPDLLKSAEDSFYSLGFKKMWAVGEGKFEKLAKFVGFKNALLIRELIKKTK